MTIMIIMSSKGLNFVVPSTYISHKKIMIDVKLLNLVAIGR